MLFLQIVLFLFFALAVPVGMGAGIAAFVEKQRKNPGFMWMAGCLLYFAVFQIVSVPFIIKGALFSTLVRCFAVLAVAGTIAGTVLWVWQYKRRPLLCKVHERADRTEKLLWLVFALILLIQLFLMGFLAYGDGDDAYFVAVTTTTDTFDSMYRFSPYTGSSTRMDIRHCLSPFPVFLAFLGRVSGLHGGVVSHVAMPLLLLPLVYGIYGMIGNRLFGDKKKQLAVFLLFAELLIIWGNYSLYTAETFLVARTGQGKAVLGNVIIPALFLLLHMMGEPLMKNKKIEKSLWILLFALVTASCLCSLMGGLLVTVLLAVFFLCVVCAYRKWKLLLPIAVCMLPALVYAGIYVIMN